MSFHLTVEMLPAAWDLLRTTPPYRSWKLPPAAEVKFRVNNSYKDRGEHFYKNGKHNVTISARNVGSLSELTRVMAHEMVHAHEENSRVCRADVHHSWRFNRWARSVCNWHCWDWHAF